MLAEQSFCFTADVSFVLLFRFFFAVRGRFADRYQALPHVQDDPDL